MNIRWRDTINYFAIVCILFVATIIALAFLRLQVQFPHMQQYAELSRSFMHGSLAFSGPVITGYTNDAQPVLGTLDMAEYDGSLYWHLGILPAIVLIPFVYIFDFFTIPFIQGYLAVLCAAVSGVLIYRISKKINYTNISGWWWVIAAIVATPFFHTITHARSWFLAGAVAFTLEWIIVYEWYGKRRPWIMGLGSALAVASRPSILLALPILFILVVRFRKDTFTRTAVQFMVPIVIVGMSICTYNYARFDSILESGYRYSNLSYDPSTEATREKYGLISLRNIPSNIYYSLFGGLEPIIEENSSNQKLLSLSFPYFSHIGWGIGLGITSWYIFRLFSLPIKRTEDRLWITAGICVYIPLLLWMSNGMWQIGYRFSLDFLPFILIALMSTYKTEIGELTWKMKLAITACALLTIATVFLPFKNIF